MIDSHAHLTDRRYGGAADIIDNMRADGLEAVITVGYDTASSISAVALAESRDGVYAAVGIHPTDFDRETSIEGILPLLSRKKVVAYGEIGLDYYWDKPARDVQKKWLKVQLDAAVSHGKPIIIHSRDCDGDMLPVLKQWARKLNGGLVMHCFSSSAEMAKEYVKLGFYISFAGPITYKNADRSAAVLAVPDELLLAETDCPYLTPQPQRGKLNYPAYVRYVIEKLAEIKNADFESIERLTTANAKRLFNLPL